MKKTTQTTIIVGILWILSLPSALAQTNLSPPSASSGETDLAQTMSLAEIIQTGGPLMYVLGAMSLIGFALVLYFLSTLRHATLAPTGFIDTVFELIEEQDLSQARVQCQQNKTPAAAICYAALDYCVKTEEPNPELLHEVIEGEGARQASRISNQIKYLEDIAVISPMVGLLGTVIGMLSTFNVVALDIAKARPMLLAEGVSQALITTAAGLMVGIPAMACYAYFRGRSARLFSHLEEISVELLTLLHRRKKPSTSMYS